MVDISSQNNKINITVSSSGNTANTNVTPDYAQYYSEKSKEWAISNKIVDNTDYSSKYYANESKKQANISTAKATEVIESGNTALNNIDMARNNAILDITNQESLSVDNVNTAGATQIALATEQANIATNKTTEVVASGNEALANIDTAKNNAITSITNQETTSKTSLIDEGATQIGLIQNEGATQIANVQSTGFYMRDDKLYYINSQGEETEFKSGGSGLEVCDIGMALYVDETKGLRRYLNGQIVDINTNTQAFLNRLKEITTLHPSLLCTEEEWQTAKTMSAFGQVGKFVFNYNGADIVSVRLPRVVNVQGLFDLQNLGMTVEAGLPNITGSSGNSYSGFNNSIESGVGAIRIKNIVAESTKGSGSSYKGVVNFNASLSNPIYGNSDTVQPEAIQYPYFIQIATGSETENNIINDIELNNPYSLFDSKYSDHELNNLSWLKSEGQWNSKAVYPTAYDELLTEYNNSASTTETEGSITFKRTPKGYKIALANQETAIDTKYATHGIAWYYILDTTNEKFKLPRTKFGFEGLRTSVGDDIAESLPNIKGGVKNDVGEGIYGAYTGAISLIAKRDNPIWQGATSVDRQRDWDFNASRSSSTYKDGAPVQERATQMYLYFYVGETVQNANLIDAGRIGEQLATKTDMLQASGAGMPSSKYIDLTLGATGSTYTAPANGWVQAVCNSSSNSPAFIEVNTEYASSTGTRYKDCWGRATIPVTRGRTFNVYYGGADFEIKMFRFTYAEGEV